MISNLLPAGVHSHYELSDVPALLYPEERAAVVGAVEMRVREFATGRHCARRALAALGRPTAPIIRGPNREPVWPRGVVGSVTHCRGYRAAAVAASTTLASVGIDAEKNESLPAGVIEAIADPGELKHLKDLGDVDARVHWPRLLFSAKESVFKAWFPMTGRWLDHTDATVRFDQAGNFAAELLVEGPRIGSRQLDAFHGRWLVGGGLILTAVAVPLSLI